MSSWNLQLLHWEKYHQWLYSKWQLWRERKKKHLKCIFSNFVLSSAPWKFKVSGVKMISSAVFDTVRQAVSSLLYCLDSFLDVTALFSRSDQFRGQRGLPTVSCRFLMWSSQWRPLFMPTRTTFSRGSSEVPDLPCRFCLHLWFSY